MKRLSLLLTVFMIFQMIAFFEISGSAAGESSSFSGLTFHDIAYSPELDMYVAGANDTSKGYLFASADGETWALTKTTSIIGYGGEYDSIVWWQEAHVFAVYLKSQEIWLSSDGYTWNKGGFVSVDFAAGLSTDEGKLLLYGRKSVKIYDNVTDFISYTTISDATDSYIMTMMAAGGTGSTKTYIAVASYRGSFSSDAGATWTLKPSFAAFGTLKDIVYSENQNCFYSVVSTQGWKIARIERNGSNSSVTTTGFVGSERGSAITVGNGITVLGTDAGNFYYAQDSTAFTPTAAVWTSIPVSSGSANTVAAKRIVYGKDKFVAVAKGGIAVIGSDASSYKMITTYLNSPYAVNIQGTNRIEIPAAGQNPVTKSYTYSIIDLKQQVIASDTVSSFVPSGTLPQGVSFSNNSLTVDSTAQPGTVKLAATSQQGLKNEVDVQLVAETGIQFNGPASAAIPAYGDPAESWNYSASVLGSDGKLMDRSAQLTLTSVLPDGVSYDAQSGTLTITDTAQGGEITFAAQSLTTPSVTGTLTVTIKERMPTTVEITSPQDTLVVPDSKSVTLNYSAVVKDQTNKDMPQKSVTWAVGNTDLGGRMTGISIKPDTGVLTVTSSAYNVSLIIRASVVGNTSVYAQVPLTLTFSDARSVKEDTLQLSLSSDTLDTNLTLPSAGSYGSAISWLTSDSDVITKDGTITRKQRQDTSAQLTATVLKGSESKTKTFDVTVLKLDNILSNGGFEDADSSAWTAVGATIAQDNTRMHSGAKCLFVSGRTAPENGVSQTVALHNDSTYLFEGYIRADSETFSAGIYAGGQKVASGTASTNGYVRMGGIYSYSGKASEFDETITVSTADSSAVSGFYLDDMRVYEITLDLDTLMSAIQKAEYTRLPADISAAKTLCNSFYDSPLKQNLAGRIASIQPKNSGGSTGGTGGHSSGSGKAVISLSPSALQTVDNSEKVADALLIFKDLKGHWAKDDVEFMAKKGFVSGREEGVFAPDDNITRAEFLALLCRTVKLPDTKYANSFFDVTGDDWFGSYVQAARDAGYAGGSNGLFRPNDPITREEMTKMIVSAYNNKKKTALQTGGALYYSDFYNISAWAYDYIVNAVNLKLVTGVTDTMFMPKQLATRAETVVTLKRLYDQITAE